MLKKGLFLFLFLFIFSIQSYAQVNIGLKAGVNYARQNITNLSSDYSGFDYKYGYHLGIYGSFPVFKMLSLNAEILFSDKGCKNKPTDFSPELTTHYYYLNAPVLLQYQPMNKFKIQAGLEFGYLLKSRY